MARTISILTDNRTADPGRFGCEHGLSVVLQTPSAKVLMDTGASGLFSVNAARMGIDLSEVDYVFLSHGHSDHVGGLKTFLDLNSTAKVQVIQNPFLVTPPFSVELKNTIGHRSRDFNVCLFRERHRQLSQTPILAPFA